MIDPERLVACGIARMIANQFAKPIENTFRLFAISTLEQRAAFLAQAIHESRGLSRLSENLNYSTPERIKAAFRRLRNLPEGELLALCMNPKGLAAAAYSNMNGNGGQLSGDGWLYRGSGIFQLTGRANFTRAAEETGRPYVDQPDLVRSNPEDAALTAGLFWKWAGCNLIVLEGDFDGVSKVINLGRRDSTATPNGNEERRTLYATCLKALA